MATAHEVDLTPLEDDTRCITYQIQTSKVVPGSEDCVFTIHDEASVGPVTVAQWEAEASEEAQGDHSSWKDRCLRCLLRLQEFKAVYMTGQNSPLPSFPNLPTHSRH